jgi:hypothetical protein
LSALFSLEILRSSGIEQPTDLITSSSRSLSRISLSNCKDVIQKKVIVLPYF